jgi:hypothetical protein
MGTQSPDRKAELAGRFVAVLVCVQASTLYTQYCKPNKADYFLFDASGFDFSPTKRSGARAVLPFPKIHHDVFSAYAFEPCSLLLGAAAAAAGMATR